MPADFLDRTLLAKMAAGSGLICKQAKLVRAHGVEWKTVPCGHCETCVKSRKSQWSGRMCAEAQAASSVVFATLTYREGEEGAQRFIFAHVERMIRTLRQRFRRNGHGTFRYAVVGEQGTVGTQRCHWHAMLFFKGECPLENWSQATHPGQLWPWWEYGWADVQVFASNDPQVPQKAFYVAKYCVKTAFEEQAVFRYSSKPPLGDEVARGIARRTAQAGLPLRGDYNLPGVYYTRGRFAHQLIPFHFAGTTAVNVCAEYVSEWERLHGREVRGRSGAVLRYEGGDGRKYRPVPVTDFLLKHHSEAVMFIDPDRTLTLWRSDMDRAAFGQLDPLPLADPEGSAAKRARDRAAFEPFGPPSPFPAAMQADTPVLVGPAGRKAKAGTVPGPDQPWPHRPKLMTPAAAARARRPGILPVCDAAGRLLGMLNLDRGGHARFTAESGLPRAVKIDQDLRGVVDLSEETHDAIAQWISDGRGPDFLPIERRREYYAARNAEYERLCAERATEIAGAREAYQQLRARADTARVSAQLLETVLRQRGFRPVPDYGPGPFVPLGERRGFDPLDPFAGILSDAQLVEDQLSGAGAHDDHADCGGGQCDPA